MRLLFILACFVAAASADGASTVLADPIFADGYEPDTSAGPGPTQSCPFTANADGFFTLNSASSSYVVRLPVGYSVANPQPQRLLVALHGCGDTAMNFATWAAVPSALRDSQNYIAISIGGRENQCWNISTDAALVTAAISHVRSCFYVHQRRVVLAGFSSGGMLAYKMAMTDALKYAGVLIENSGLSQAVGVGNVDATLNSAAWRINVAHSARTEDGSFLIAGVRGDRDKLLAHAFPLQYRELAGTHDGSTDDWALYLIPRMVNWTVP